MTIFEYCIGYEICNRYTFWRGRSGWFLLVFEFRAPIFSRVFWRFRNPRIGGKFWFWTIRIQVKLKSHAIWSFLVSDQWSRISTDEIRMTWNFGLNDFLCLEPPKTYENSRLHQAWLRSEYQESKFATNLANTRFYLCSIWKSKSFYNQKFFRGPL